MLEVKKRLRQPQDLLKMDMCGSVTLLDLCVSALPLCRNRQVLQHP